MTAPAPVAKTASCSSSKAIRPADRPSRGAIARKQAILPLRGKVMNTEGMTLAKVLENKELADLVTALGCGMGKNFDLGAAALRQGHHPRRRRLRRPPHRHAAAHVHLPAPAAADRERPGLPCAAAALSHRHRQGDVLGARRCASRSAAEAARQRPQPPGDHAVQGTRRDDAEGAVGDDAQSADAPAAARRDRRIRSSPIASSTS